MSSMHFGPVSAIVLALAAHTFDCAEDRFAEDTQAPYVPHVDHLFQLSSVAMYFRAFNAS
ncbi:hypothetical protein CCR75_007467 [Bremia lactucae]|uniref:Uncharacterized protein n=1 Tax=Bremia lactucae TaxID=4779 RepID=A0A976FK48_BRELC|nr:hypothetical protein CCR75_007467 [Bremia lactucae]